METVSCCLGRCLYVCVLLLLFLSSKLLPVHVLGRFFFCFLCFWLLQNVLREGEGTIDRGFELHRDLKHLRHVCY